MDAVFSLQRAGSDGVFSFQFPVAAAVVTGAGAGLGAWPYQQRPNERPQTTARKSLRELQADEAERQRAAEIADAAVAPAASAPQAEQSAEPFAQPIPADAAPPLLAVLQVQQTALSPAIAFSKPLPVAVAQPLNLAALDEDAILAASVLLMRRRLTR